MLVPLLRLLNEYGHNRAHRCTFPPDNASGFVLLRELGEVCADVTRFVTPHATATSDVNGGSFSSSSSGDGGVTSTLSRGGNGGGETAVAPSLQWKVHALCLSAGVRLLTGRLGNPGIMALYGDRTPSALRLSLLQLVIAVPLDVLAALPKLAVAVFDAACVCAISSVSEGPTQVEVGDGTQLQLQVTSDSCPLLCVSSPGALLQLAFLPPIAFGAVTTLQGQCAGTPASAAGGSTKAFAVLEGLFSLEYDARMTAAVHAASNFNLRHGSGLAPGTEDASVKRPVTTPGGFVMRPVDAVAIAGAFDGIAAVHGHEFSDTEIFSSSSGGGANFNLSGGGSVRRVSRVHALLCPSTSPSTTTAPGQLGGGGGNPFGAASPNQLQPQLHQQISGPTAGAATTAALDGVFGLEFMTALLMAGGRSIRGRNFNFGGRGGGGLTRVWNADPTPAPSEFAAVLLLAMMLRPSVFRAAADGIMAYSSTSTSNAGGGVLAISTAGGVNRPADREAVREAFNDLAAEAAAIDAPSSREGKAAFVFPYLRWAKAVHGRI